MSLVQKLLDKEDLEPVDVVSEKKAVFPSVLIGRAFTNIVPSVVIPVYNSNVEVQL